MSFLFPGFLAAAGAVAAAAAVLHLIVTREPDLFRLPTARFAPERAIQARARAVQPSDLLLLAVRMALVLAVGAALARPIVSPPRSDLVRIVLLDRSRAAASAGEAADSARTVLGERDLLIVFDSAATLVASGAADSLQRLSLTETRGRLSTALVSALRTVSSIRDRADSIELVLVSPLVGEEVDASTDSLRALWPAGIRLIRTAARADSVTASVTLEGAPDDPLRLALPDASMGSSDGTIRVIRRLATADDSVWAAGAGHALVVWPSSGEVPGGWTPRTRDTVGAVAVGTAVVVAPFVRALSSQAAEHRVLARWVDGEPAAIEATQGAGCIRTVTIDVPAVGDLVLEPRFVKLAASLAGRCGGARLLAPLGDAARAGLAGSPGSNRALAAGFPAPEQVPSPWARWLLLGAGVLMAAEMLLRRRIAR